MEEAVGKSPRGPRRPARVSAAAASVCEESSPVEMPTPSAAPVPAPYSTTAEPECPPTPLRGSDVLGVVALLAAAGALLCASSRQLSGFVLPVSGGGVLLGLLAVAGAWSLSYRMRWPALGAATAGTAAITAWLFPGLLGQAYWMSRQPAPVVDMQIRAVPLAASKERGTPVGEEWVNAAESALQQGPLRVWIAGVRLIPAPPVDDDVPKKDEVREDRLLIRLRVQIVEDARQFAGHQAQMSLPRGEDLQPQLLDKGGRALPRREVEHAAAADHVIRSSMFPVSVEDRTFGFAAPSAGSQDLRFEVPAEPLGGKGMYRFTIPASLLRRDFGGDLRVAPAPNR